MRRWLAVVALCALGCSGLSERALELAGGSMEIGDNGDVTMTLPDGTRVASQVGGELPDGWPAPPPYDGATPQTVVVTTSPEGSSSYVATYEMNAPRDEIADRYATWLEAHGTVKKRDEEKAAGMVTESLVGEVDAGAVIVTLTEAFGANSVTVVWAPDGVDSIPR